MTTSASKSEGEVRSERHAYQTQPSLEEEPSRLLVKKEYRAAVIAVFSALEHELRQLLESATVNSFASRSSLFMLLEYAMREKVLSSPSYDSIRKYMAIRNKIAHTRSEVTAQLARSIVADVSKAIATVREANLKRRLDGRPSAGTSGADE